MKRILSCCTLNLFFLLISTQGSAQNHELLWYSGKKISDTSLQTATGYKVVYSPTSGSVKVSNMSGKSVSTSIAKGLKNREQFKKKVIKIITSVSGGTLNINLANLAAQTIDEVDQSMETSSIASEELTISSPLEGSTVYSKLIPPWVQNDFDEVVNYVITLKEKEKLLPDAPPSIDLDYCYPCDQARQEKFRKDSATYYSQFFDAHSKMISKGFGVIRYFEHRRVKHLPYDSVAGERMTTKMNNDIHYLLDDLAGSIADAWKLYKNDATKLPVLAKMVLSVIRQYELFGMPTHKDIPSLQEIGETLVTVMTKYFDEAVKERDYPVILNIGWYMGLMRQSALIFGEDDRMGENLMHFLQANRFEMEVDAEGKLGKDGQNMLAKMKGSSYYRAIPDKDCKLQWHLYDPPSNMKFNLQKAELNLGVPATYTGTREWYTPPANIQLGFCEKPGRDTLIMQNFMPRGEESWVVQGQPTPGGFIVSIFNQCFLDEKRLKEAAVKAKQDMEKKKKEMMDAYNNAIKGNEELLKKDPAQLTAAERKKLQEIVAASEKIKNILTDTNVAHNVLFKEGLQNHLKTVFDGEIDGQKLFPRNTAIQYAKFKVKLVHVEE